MKNYIKHCKYCMKPIVWLSHKGRSVAVEPSTIDLEERRSLMMDLTVPFEPLRHTRHSENCIHQRKNYQPTNYLRY